MCKYKIILVLAVLAVTLLIPVANAQTCHWYKDIESLEGKTLGIAHDDKYVYATGYLYGGQRDLFVVKMNSSTGDFEWIKTLNPSPGGNEYVYDVSYYGNYLYTIGYSDSFNNNGYNEIILVKIGTSGTMEYLKKFSNTTNDVGYSIKAVANGVYIAGYMGSNNGDILVMKLSQSGTVEWAKGYGGASTDSGEGVEYIGGYIYVVGATASFGGYYDAFVMKLNSNDGSIVWSKRFGGSEYDKAYAIAGDGEYLYVTGYTYSYGSGYSDVFVLKMDTDGNFVWFKTLGGLSYDFAYYITVVGDKLFVIGDTKSYGAGDYDYIVYELDKNNGTVLSAKTVGSSAKENMRSATIFNSLFYIGGFSNIRNPSFIDPTILLYSPSISTLSWTGNEGWEDLKVSNPSVTSFSQNPNYYDVEFNVESINFAEEDLTSSYSLDSISLTIHTAEDTSDPVPVPEPTLTSVIVLTLTLLLLAIKTNK